MNDYSLNTTGIIILAAGASTRLGRAKQTLDYKDKSLLKHAIDAAVNAVTGPVIVVVGANEKEILSQIQNEPVMIARNNNWKEGIASSIHTGLTYLQKHKKEVEDVILMVCDQPYVDAQLLKGLIAAKSLNNRSIVACSYKDTIGVPALFDKEFFSELLLLKGEEGGKKILLKHLNSVTTIPFNKGNIDIDTIGDYERLSLK